MCHKTPQKRLAVTSQHRPCRPKGGGLPRILPSAKPSFKSEGEMQSRKNWSLLHSRATSQVVRKEVLRAESKWPQTATEDGVPAKTSAWFCKTVQMRIFLVCSQNWLKKQLYSIMRNRYVIYLTRTTQKKGVGPSCSELRKWPQMAKQSLLQCITGFVTLTLLSVP